MKKLVIGLFPTYEKASLVFDDLISKGYWPKDISIISKEPTLRKLINESKDSLQGISETAAAGGIIGGLLGLLAGTGVLVIPGLGALLIAGPIAAAFGITGVAATTASGLMTGVLAGGLLGALKELGIDEIKAATITEKIKDGYILVAVSIVENEAENVQKVLENNNAENITTLDVQE